MNSKQQSDNAFLSMGGYILVLLKDTHLDIQTLYGNFCNLHGKVKYEHFLWVLEFLKMRGVVQEKDRRISLSLY